MPRLLLQKGEVSRQYEVERINNVTDACNFYGASQPLCTLATEFFSGVTGPVGDLLLVTRFPSESTWSCGRCNETSRDRFSPFQCDACSAPRTGCASSTGRGR